MPHGAPTADGPARDWPPHTMPPSATRPGSAPPDPLGAWGTSPADQDPGDARRGATPGGRDARDTSPSGQAPDVRDTSPGRAPDTRGTSPGQAPDVRGTSPEQAPDVRGTSPGGEPDTRDTSPGWAPGEVTPGGWPPEDMPAMPASDGITDDPTRAGGASSGLSGRGSHSPGDRFPGVTPLPRTDGLSVRGKAPGADGMPGHGSAPDPGFVGDPGVAGRGSGVTGRGFGQDRLHEALDVLGPADLGRPGECTGRFEMSDGGPGSVRVVDVDWRSLGRPLPAPPEPPEESTVTDLSILADAIVEATRLTGVRRQPSPWLEPLPAHLVLDQVHAMTGRPRAYTGMGGESTTRQERPERPGTHTGPAPQSGRSATHRHPAEHPDSHTGAIPQIDYSGTHRHPAAHPDAYIGPDPRSSLLGSHDDPAERPDAQHTGWSSPTGRTGPPRGPVERPEAYTGPVSENDPTGTRRGPDEGPDAHTGWNQQTSAMGTYGRPAGHPDVYAGPGPRIGHMGTHSDFGSSDFMEVEPIPFGVIDRPWAQDRRPLALDLPHGGHLLIAGSARTGRSTALRTVAGAIAAQASPADVHVHAIDCGSGALLPLVAMPHCGAVVTRDQLDRVERLLGRLRAEVGRRQQLLAEAGHASLAEYRAAGHRLPWLVFMLDRWEGYVAAFESYDYGRLIDAVLQLLREGPAVGLRAVVTGDRSCLMGQVSTVFDDRLILRLADPADYGLAGFPLKGLPSSMPPGRALSIGEHGVVESQIALLTADPSGPAQVGALQDLARSASGHERGQGTMVAGPGGADRGAWLREGEPPLRVDALPMRITAGEAAALAPAFSRPSPLWALVGAGGDALAPLGIDLYAQGPGAVIAGPPRSGRSSVLLTAAHSLIAHGTPVVAVAPRRSPLRDLRGAVAVLDGNATDLQELLAEHKEYVVLVDDAELISPDGPLGMALEEVLRSGRDGDHGLIIAGSTGDLTQAYRGFVAETRKSRTGVLLSVQSPADGDLLSVRLPRGAVGGPPGRGLLVTMGTMTPIQAALPEGGV
ncbi:hypothetical protein HTZ77_02020 [Nonomuraea sp. SMC257]|uniref:FtsK domain-containing protein n=2 Tax=Nonomuraea montanisoli TaxID=2741721 RepID=A0A7Y6I290_9ACTN|nr:hypothetical protein [Nonomuraea montanisoli]